MMILCVRLEVFRQIVDTFGEEGYLDFRRARIAVVHPKSANDFRFPVLAEHGSLSRAGQTGPRDMRGTGPS